MPQLGPNFWMVPFIYIILVIFVLEILYGGFVVDNLSESKLNNNKISLMWLW